ncbi:HlyD family secretion protein, partial [Acinetobacter baumannii]|nr:HlyD family secretion protein [Acinetobacter baumannii]
VQTGERLMTLADPAQALLTVYLAPEDAIALDPGADVRAYLNVAPLSSYAAQVTQASYEAGTSPEGTPAYVIKAAFAPGETVPRLGLKGTAKV